MMDELLNPKSELLNPKSETGVSNYEFRISNLEFPRLTSVSPFLAPGESYGPIQADLAEVERILEEALRNPQERIAALVDHVRHFRGKRLRPALLLLTGRACGLVTPEHHILAAVMEMIHTATLVHDDVLDGATIRRHVATVNAEWGVTASVLLGDYLFTHAFLLATSLDDIQVCEIIGKATKRTCEGELYQGLLKGNLELSEEEYLTIIDGKTADLISCCCRLGALYSRAVPEVVEILAGYGRWLGLAFQITDDLLDLTGDEGKTGKSLGTDLDLQKLTLPLIYLLRQASAATVGRLRHFLLQPGNHKREVLRPVLVESGALQYALRRAREFADRARKELEILPPSPSRAALEKLTHRVIERNT
jgi:octaprenyl-diphosphate synthase